MLATLTPDVMGVEDALRRYAFHATDQLRENFKFIPLYLRDLLWTTSSQYVHTQSSYDQLVQHLVGEVPHDVLFINLNYDNMLEKAITRYSPDHRFEVLREYVKVGRSPLVVKLHGSVDWFMILQPNVGDWADAVREREILKPPEEDIVIMPGKPTALSLRHSGNYMYPLITAPIAGKELADVVCPDSHVDVAQEFLSACEKFLIIGTSGLDHDLFALLNASVATGSHMIQVVGKEQAWETSDRFRQQVAAFSDPDPRKPYVEGFRAYVSSDDWRAFADA